jgi:hypothetical protein
MKLLQSLCRIGVLLITLSVLGCSDDGMPVGPVASNSDALTSAFAAKGGNGKGRSNDTTGTASDSTADTTATDSEDPFQLVDRPTPLRHDVTRSAVIGSWGGVISMPQEGLNLVIPYGALDEDVEITVTALAGSKIAYELQPHGLRFNKPVHLWIAKDAATRVEGVYGIYFAYDLSGSVHVFEYLMPLLEEFWFILETDHFSGYALASGSRKSRSLDSSF